MKCKSCETIGIERLKKTWLIVLRDKSFKCPKCGNKDKLDDFFVEEILIPSGTLLTYNETQI